MTDKFIASAIVSELQNSDIHMTIKARLFDLATNLNGVRVTEAFMDEIVQHEDKYVCIPLCADIRGLLANRSIGHMYDNRTGEFHSTMIGSFYHFEKEVVGDNAYLVGYARLPKRNKAVCAAISNLFAEGALKFSFEISCGSCIENEDGTIVIDADERNHIEGEAIVTFPACEDAIALDLVAECLGKGDENMADAENIAESIQEEPVNTDAPKEDSAQKENVAETIVSESAAPEENASCKNEENSSVEDAANECSEAADPEKEAEPEEEAPMKEDKTAELIEEIKNQTAELKAQIAELNIAELKNQIDALKVQIAELTAVKPAETVNPFMAEMKAPVKYSLLEREEKHFDKYTLLDKA